MPHGGARPTSEFAPDQHPQRFDVAYEMFDLRPQLRVRRLEIAELLDQLLFGSAVPALPAKKCRRTDIMLRTNIRNGRTTFGGTKYFQYLCRAKTRPFHAAIVPREIRWDVPLVVHTLTLRRGTVTVVAACFRARRSFQASACPVTLSSYSPAHSGEMPGYYRNG